MELSCLGCGPTAPKWSSIPSLSLSLSPSLSSVLRSRGVRDATGGALGLGLGLGTGSRTGTEDGGPGSQTMEPWEEGEGGPTTQLGEAKPQTQ